MPPPTIQDSTLEALEASGLLADVFILALRGLQHLPPMKVSHLSETVDLLTGLRRWGYHVWERGLPPDSVSKIESFIPGSLHSQLLQLLINVIVWAGQTS